MKAIFGIKRFLPLLIIMFSWSNNVCSQTFTAKYTTAIHSNVNGYYEYLPAGYNLPQNANKKYPVIFYFHGGTQIGANNGNNLEALKAAGIPQVIYQGKMPTYFTKGTDTFSYIIICPQMKTEYMATEATAVVDYILGQTSAYRIDKGKVYVTGFSWGGRATWRFMMASAANSKKVAAALTIGQYCYSSPSPDLTTIRYPAQAGVAVWAIHNTNDNVTPSSTCGTDYINKFNSYSPAITAKLTLGCIPSSSQCGHLDTTQNYIYNPSYKLSGTGMSVYEWFYQYRQLAAGVPPVANAGTDQTITFPVKQVTLNGSGTDSDGTISTYAWKKISGPSAFTISNSAAASTIVSGLVAGTYNFELTVTDNQSFTAKDTVKVTVVNPAANIAPVANAGADNTISLPVTTYTLNGSASADSDGSIESYSWQLISGPTGSSFTNAAVTNAVVNGLKPGTYVFRLTVTDNQSATSTDDIQLTVKNNQLNKVPVANAGTDVTIILPTSSVTLSAAASADSDGVITAYLWKKVSGPQSFQIVSPSAATTVVNSLTEGIYGFELTVTDDSAATKKDTVLVTVTSQQRVLIDIGASSTASPDASGKYWNMMTDARAGVRVQNAKTTINTATTINLEVVNRIDGTFNTAANGLNSNSSGAAVSDYPSTATIDYAFASPTTTTGSWKFTGLDATKQYSVKFWGNRSDVGPRIIQIKASDETTWKEYDAAYNTNYNNAAVFSFTGKTEVTYNIRVKSGSSFGYINVVDITISSSGTTNQAPVAKAGTDISLTLPTNSTALNGSTSTDADGTIASYLWAKLSGPTQYTLSSTTVSQPTLSNLVQGVYQFKLTVTDNAGATSNDTVAVTVNAAQTTRIADQRILIDLGSTSQTPSPDASGKYWNNMTDARVGVRVQNAKTTNNEATAVTLEVVNRIDGTYNTNGNGLNGVSSATAVNDYPSTAVMDYAFAHSSTTAGLWKFSGLDATRQYSIKFWGTKNESKRIIQIKPSDATTWQEYDAGMNTDYNNGVVFSFTGKTEISFNIRVKSGSQFSYINVIDITVTTPTTAARGVRATEPEGLREEEQKRTIGALDIYPNPVTTNFTLRLINNETGKVAVTIYNAQMQPLKKLSYIKRSSLFIQPMNISDLGKGVYFIEMQTGDKKVIKKLVKL